MIYDILHHHKHTADGIAALLHPYAEVVLHDLIKQEVVYIANNLSKRDIGSPSYLKELEIHSKKDIVGPYMKTNWDGALMKCVSIVLRDEPGDLIGLICINIDLSQFQKLQTVFAQFLNSNFNALETGTVFKNDWHEKINIFINQWLRENQLTHQTLEIRHKKELIRQLYLQGAFEGKKAAEYVASILNLGRATVFKYLSEVKGVVNDERYTDTTSFTRN